MKKFIFSAVLAAALSSAPAHAFSLAAKGGFGLGAGSEHAGYDSIVGPILGGEFTYGLGPVDFGVFYDYFKLNSSLNNANGSVSFMGGVGRFTIPAMGVFVDAKLGSSKVSTSASFSWGVGLGMSYDLGPVISIKPRLGYNKLEVSGPLTRDVWELGVLIAVGF